MLRLVLIRPAMSGAMTCTRMLRIPLLPPLLELSPCGLTGPVAQMLQTNLLKTVTPDPVPARLVPLALEAKICATAKHMMPQSPVTLLRQLL